MNSGWNTLITTRLLTILTLFKNRDRGAEFDVLEPFRQVLGQGLEEAALLEAMPAFFTQLIEIDPDVLLERPKLDVPLREGLRIASDWVDLLSPLPPTKVAIAQKGQTGDQGISKSLGKAEDGDGISAK